VRICFKGLRTLLNVFLSKDRHSVVPEAVTVAWRVFVVINAISPKYDPLCRCATSLELASRLLFVHFTDPFFTM
jgi:hypothetical protein